jgi:hypothetical protein
VNISSEASSAIDTTNLQQPYIVHAVPKTKQVSSTVDKNIIGASQTTKYFLDPTKILDFPIFG